MLAKGVQGEVTGTTENRETAAEKRQEMPEAQAAMAGREYWLRIKERYLPDEETGLIIVQAREPDMIDTAVRLIPAYLKRKYLKRAILVADQETAAEIGLREKPSGITLVAAERKVLEELLTYYRLVQFFHEIAVISVEEPYGNAHIIGNEGIALEDYVRNALYV